ncbi:hypothetical protein T484DRAFT_1938093 [Baffinella frigidus]|nr:hypothetical protein T484DRAFT_1938093 [Cryptophyta sp. CCMP2293]
MASKALVCCVVLLALLGFSVAADKAKALNEMDVDELRTEVRRFREDQTEILSRLGEAERRASEAEMSRDAMVANAAGAGSGDKSLEGQGKAFMEVQQRMSKEMGQMGRSLGEAREDYTKAKMRVRELEEEMVQARKAMRDCMNRHAPHMKGAFSEQEMHKIREQQLKNTRLGKDEM